MFKAAERHDVGPHEFTVIHCPKCHWRSEVYRGGVGGLSRCPQCGTGTQFVHFNADEVALTEGVVGGPLTWPVAWFLKED